MTSSEKMQSKRKRQPPLQMSVALINSSLYPSIASTLNGYVAGVLMNAAIGYKQPGFQFSAVYISEQTFISYDECVFLMIKLEELGLLNLKFCDKEYPGAVTYSVPEQICMCKEVAEKEKPVAVTIQSRKVFEEFIASKRPIRMANHLLESVKRRRLTALG